ncbi:phosphoinositide-3-kinase-interacting protein 1 [Macrotis lagotis]|uniref:phosphoinositide-3-kinase-interacting protein 1 n=1 Tax=Macrotis lagotis TaxID=92651 RepID=UPI003D6841F3
MRSGRAGQRGRRAAPAGGPALLLGAALLGAALPAAAWGAPAVRAPCPPPPGFPPGCFWDQGRLLRGDQRFSADGLPCLDWRDPPSGDPGPLGPGCRNPDSDPAGPWCFVRGPAGAPQKRRCRPAPCAGTPTQETLPLPTAAGTSQEPQGAEGEAFEVADSLPSNSESAAVRPVIGVNQKVRMLSEKKDLGMIGYVLGITMTVIIVATGAGIVLGYVYKRGKDFKEQREQKTYEREMQRITLPLSAFTNPACEIVDEKTIVIHTHRTPGEDAKDGNAPLMGQAGTPGA